MKKFAIMGYGVVGSGVAEVFNKNKDLIEKRIGDRVELKYILEIREPKEDDVNKSKFTKSFEDILNDEEISVVCEVMGGISFAYDFVKRLLEKGKSVVSSNKELVAKKGAELLRLAKDNGCKFLFEASVGGGIPLLRPIHNSLLSDEILEIKGILNGTTNYILTKMARENESFEACLKKAQELGYAEKDPTADIEGFDAVRKISILASMAFGKHIYPKYAELEGITKISPEDSALAKALGGSIKLLGICKAPNEQGKCFVNVSPYIVLESNPLYAVNDVFNGVLVTGNVSDEVMFYGKGAGKMPTAAAVMGDAMEIMIGNTMDEEIWWEDSSENLVSDYKEEKYPRLVRVKFDREVLQRLKDEKEVKIMENSLEGEIDFILGEISEYALEGFLEGLGAIKLSSLKIMK